MPAGHAEHDEFVPVPDRENEPEGHAEHDEFVPAPEVEKEPAGQAVQLADDWAAYVPAVQGVHREQVFHSITCFYSDSTFRVT